MLSGSLTEMNLAEVLRLLSASSQSGCLVLHADAPFAFFYLKIGQLSHCECLLNSPGGPVKIKGLDAVSRACASSDASFRFDAEMFCEEESLLVYPTAKLLDSIGLFLEKKKNQGVALPDKDAILTYQAGKSLKNFKATQDELSLLLLANGKRSIVEIADASNCTIRAIQEWAAKFMSWGLLAVVSAEAPPERNTVRTETLSTREGPAPDPEPSRAETRKTIRFWRGKPIEE